MDVRTAFYIPEGETIRTFDKDDELPSLPLPTLEHSLEKYYQNLLPFGSDEELKNSRRLIDDFKNGTGKKLHAMLVDKAKTEKNWVSKYWEKYAYMSCRTPLLPYCSMAQPLIMINANISESKEQSVQSLSKILYSNIELWNLLRLEKYKPAVFEGKFLSSDLWKRFFSTARIPGEIEDEVVCNFKTVREGETSTDIIVCGNGKLFVFSALDSDGELITIQQIFHAMNYIHARIAFGEQRPKTPVLTTDDRSTWAKNRQHLINISEHNKNLLKIIESSHSFVSLDNHEPANYIDSAQAVIGGDLYSRWADKSSQFVQFRNGKFGCIGEHSCYDGTLSISFDLFLQLSVLEQSEPDWEAPLKEAINVRELVFDVDDYILNEVARVEAVAAEVNRDVIVHWNQFQGFGKTYLKTKRVHPDAFVQMALQLTYYKLHKEFAPTYETALTRFYYRGRTETVRSCTKEATEWTLAMLNPKVTDKEKLQLLKVAIDKQNLLMKEAREGKGFDRHLFALWCLGFENGIETHEIYTEPLSIKSGGGGNFILSTSLLGYTSNVGCVAPMVTDGYGTFYSITEENIYSLITTFRKSEKTSTSKFVKELYKTFFEMKNLLDNTTPQNTSKL